MSANEWHLHVLRWPSPLFEQANELRYRVLHEPFGVERDDRWDDEDAASFHVGALAEECLVGYARLISQESGTTGQIRQVAVDPGWERRGIGSALVSELVGRTAETGMETVWLNARVTAVSFYEKLGFRVTSDVFRTPRTYLPHVRMDLEFGP